MIVVSDTTPILSLLKAGRLSLLEELYKTVAVPKAVFAELTSNAAYEDEKRRYRVRCWRERSVGIISGEECGCASYR